MIDLNSPVGMTKFYFDKNMINDMGIKIQASGETLNVETESGINTKIKKQCFTCNELVTWSDMRCHVGTHIVKEELSGINICGFCGRDVCNITLKKTSKKGSKLFFGIDKWDCDYFYKYGKAKKFNKKSNPCTNRFERCPVKDCLANIWLYNYQYHFDAKHSDQEFPSEMIIEIPEKRYHLSL